MRARVNGEFGFWRAGRRAVCGRTKRAARLGGIFGDADAKAWPLLHALEDEVDAVGIVPGHAALPGQDMVFLAHALLGPLDRQAMIAGEGFYPVLVIIGYPTDKLSEIA
jgi:hypothetical protein